MKMYFSFGIIQQLLRVTRSLVLCGCFVDR